MQIINEHYHIYNRGAHKAPIFLDGSDYFRFLSLLYVANNVKPFKWERDIPNNPYIFEKSETLTEIIAYCLMPNHFHLAMREKTNLGISRFLVKLCTGYSMYYNKKYNHSGTIFQGQYKSKHVGDDDYFRYLIQYIHLNPYGIEEPNMTKSAKQEHLAEAIEYSKNYEYSSFKDYQGENRPQRVILSRCDLAETTPRKEGWLGRKR